eukprot:COSAG05_NODE_7380_length_819_cov_1.705556_1_plen_118_part_01
MGICRGISLLLLPALADGLQHFAHIQTKLQTDGLGGHVLRAIPPLDVVLALGLQPVCHSNMLYNGKMPEAPHASGMLLGCGAVAHPSGNWAREEDLDGLPRVNVTWCDVAAIVEATAE